jgi:NAD(P)-dependent dehydrogenase (short-subunit alcohol dehydrogenase family)
MGSLFRPLYELWLGYSRMTRDFLDTKPHLMAEWSAQNPLGRLGRPDELRGVVLWLAGDGSTFCTGSE